MGDRPTTYDADPTPGTTQLASTDLTSASDAVADPERPDYSAEGRAQRARALDAARLRGGSSARALPAVARALDAVYTKRG